MIWHNYLYLSDLLVGLLLSPIINPLLFCSNLLIWNGSIQILTNNRCEINFFFCYYIIQKYFWRQCIQYVQRHRRMPSHVHTYPQSLSPCAYHTDCIEPSLNTLALACSAATVCPTSALSVSVQPGPVYLYVWTQMLMNALRTTSSCPSWAGRLRLAQAFLRFVNSCRGRGALTPSLISTMWILWQCLSLMCIIGLF